MLAEKVNLYQELAKELAKEFAPKAAHWDETRTYCHENIKSLVKARFDGHDYSQGIRGPGGFIL